MDFDNQYPKKKISPLFIVVLTGIIVATVSFFAAFVTTQKAAMPNKYKNLRIPPISAPSNLPIPDINLPVVVEENATSSLNLTPEPEINQTESTTNSSQATTDETNNP
jgi:hypothetical protein